MGKALCFGSLNIDYVYDVPRFVREGETLASLRRSVFPGGKGLNQSIALARAGIETYHAGSVGPDGRILLDALTEAKVDISFIRKTEGSSGHTIIQRDPKGLNSILLYGGANQCISEDHAAQALGGFSPDDYLILQNEINNIPLIIETAKRKGMKVVFNPSPVTEDILSYPLHLVDYFILNEIEAELLSGKTDVDGMLRGLKEKYPQAAIALTLGKKGASYTDPSLQNPISHGIYDVKVVDTTAAGDTFSGYFISSIIKNNNPALALELASKASSITVSRPGASPSIPDMDEVNSKKLKMIGS
jgi:ribokinase